MFRIPRFMVARFRYMESWNLEFLVSLRSYILRFSRSKNLKFFNVSDQFNSISLLEKRNRSFEKVIWHFSYQRVIRGNKLSVPSVGKLFPSKEIHCVRCGTIVSSPVVSKCLTFSRIVIFRGSQLGACRSPHWQHFFWESCAASLR